MIQVFENTTSIRRIDLPLRTEPVYSRAEFERDVRELGGSPGDTKDYNDPRNHIARLIASETVPEISHRKWLLRHGLAFPAPAALPAARIPSELDRIMKALVVAGVEIANTNHLSDAELYERLSAEVLEGTEPDVPRADNEWMHWDLSESCNPDSGVWLAYYASDEARSEYKLYNPGQELPPRRTFPSDRDAMRQ